MEINESRQFMEDLKMFSPENGVGGFKFEASSNPLEQLGLYMKNDDDEEEDSET